MKNISELREAILEVFISLREGKIDYKSAKEMNNAAGKAVSTVKVQLEYEALKKSIPTARIDFMEND